ncbi:hypothetical protein BGLA2_1400012 [Burkholderia gladioli]|nr:hypothetical protein BGLA2_1400012 [Burkholderia gladioli]
MFKKRGGNELPPVRRRIFLQDPIVTIRLPFALSPVSAGGAPPASRLHPAPCQAPSGGGHDMHRRAAGRFRTA